MNKSIRNVVAMTLSNVSNYPESVRPHVLGTDMSQPIDAVVAALKEAGYTDLPQEPEVDGFEPRYQPGDRVRSTHPDNAGDTGTVLWDRQHDSGWNVRVRMDDGTGTGLFMYSELEKATKNF